MEESRRVGDSIGANLQRHLVGLLHDNRVVSVLSVAAYRPTNDSNRLGIRPNRFFKKTLIRHAIMTQEALLERAPTRGEPIDILATHIAYDYCIRERSAQKLSRG
jgi:hypothetical protein